MEQQVLRIENVTSDELGKIIADQLYDKIKTQLAVSVEIEKYLNRNEAAKLLNISLPKLDDLCNNGTLKFSRIGRMKRFKYSDLLQSMDSISNKSKRK